MLLVSKLRIMFILWAIFLSVFAYNIIKNSYYFIEREKIKKNLVSKIDETKKIINILEAEYSYLTSNTRIAKLVNIYIKDIDREQHKKIFVYRPNIENNGSVASNKENKSEL